MISLHLPSFEEIKDYVACSNEFKEKLAEAGRKTKQSDKEASLELQLDLETGEQSLSQVYLGTEDLAAAIPGPKSHIALLHLHSHPNQRVIRPSSGDILSSIAINSRNFQRLIEKDRGIPKYPNLGETIELSKSYNWSATNVIVSAYDNSTIGMLLYRMITSLDKSFNQFSRKPSQENVLRVMRENGHSAVDFLKYRLDRNGRASAA